MNEEIAAPAPGSTPMMKPVIEPLRKAKRQAFSSSQLGSRLRSPFGTGSISRLVAGLDAGQHLGDREHADRDHHEVDAAEQLGLAEDEARLRGEQVGADAWSSHSPTSSDSSPLISDGPDSSTTSARPRHISAKYSGELERSAKARDRRRHQREQR